jgi:adiponectin receptor
VLAMLKARGGPKNSSDVNFSFWGPSSSSSPQAPLVMPRYRMEGADKLEGVDASRPPLTSAAGTSLEWGPLEANAAVLIQRKGLPDWYASYANEHVWDGYRRPALPKESVASVFVRSMFTWHNETLSIHSHLWPGLYWLVALFTVQSEPYYLQAPSAAQAVMAEAYFGAACMGIASALTHSFYIVSSRVAVWWWKVDFVGIIAVNFSHFLLDCYVIFWVVLNSPALFIAAAACASLFSLYCLVRIIFVQDAGRYWGVMYPLWASLPLTVPLFIYSRVGSIPSDVNAEALRATALSSLLCSVFVIVAGIFFKGEVPEKYYNPRGLFNNFNSHTLMHISIVVSIFFAFKCFPYLWLLRQ